VAPVTAGGCDWPDTANALRPLSVTDVTRGTQRSP